MQYSLRTLLWLTILAPPALAGAWLVFSQRALLDSIAAVASIVWAIVLLATPLLILAYVLACVAGAITKR